MIIDNLNVGEKNSGIKYRKDIEITIKILIVVVITYQCFPAFSYYVPGILRSATMAGIFIIPFFIITLRRKITQNELTNIIIIFFLSYIIAYTQWKNNGMIVQLYSLVVFLLPLQWGRTIIDLKEKDRKILCRYYLFVILFTCITTIIGLEIFPSASRTLAHGGLSDDVISRYSSYNIAGFSFVYSLPLLIPYLGNRVKKSRSIYKKVISIIELCLIFIVFIKSEYTIALLISAFMIFLVMFYNSQKKIRSISLIILIFFVSVSSLSIITGQIADLLYSTEHNTMAMRFEELENTLKGEQTDGDLSIRSREYTQSVRAFAEHPISGSIFEKTNEQNGEHSAILDLMGSCGLIGITCFFYILYSHYMQLKRNKKRIDYDSSVLSLFAFVILSFLNKSMFPCIGIVLFIVPYLFDKTE